VSDRDPATITLVGRTSAWQQRLPAGAADRGSRPPQPARGERLLLASWLHHPSYGTLGVYLAAEVDTHSQALRRGQWVQLCGIVRPYFAVALPDDPRSALDLTLAPLLVEVAQLLPASRGDQPPPLVLAAPNHARVLPPSPGSPAQLVSLAQWGDAVYWRATPATPAVSVAWNTVRGVVTRFGQDRYLRYVLSLRATPLSAR
jgi:hypothetical protein